MHLIMTSSTKSLLLKTYSAESNHYLLTFLFPTYKVKTLFSIKNYSSLVVALFKMMRLQVSIISTRKNLRIYFLKLFLIIRFFIYLICFLNLKKRLMCFINFLFNQKTVLETTKIFSCTSYEGLLNKGIIF